jgi:ABC-2 type transport system ATP-binding protein
MEFFSAHHIDKTFASVQALTDVSLSVEKGSIFGLLGPNGAGKTTLIRIINQITAPDKGALYLKGRKLKASDVEQIGYLPEERGLYKKMKIGEQAIYLSRLKGLSHAEAVHNLKYWFKKFDILPWWEKKVEELSKGMQQKVQFITTVVHKPSLLIFDEPFSGFDPINAHLIKQEVLKLREQGATILFSTHNMGSVEELCDHIALINKSYKIVDGPTEKIREAYKSNMFEITYQGDMEKVNEALKKYRILKHTEEREVKHLTVEFVNGSANNELIQMLLPVAQIVSFEEVIPSMNDVFIKAVESANTH